MYTRMGHRSKIQYYRLTQKFCKPVVEKSDNLNLFTPAFGFNTALKIKSEKVRPSSPVSSIYSHKRNRTPLPDVSFSANFIKGLKLERNFTNDTNEYNEVRVKYTCIFFLHFTYLLTISFM